MTNVVRGTVLQDYSFDVRDFTESQLDMLEYASILRHGNRELKSRLLSTIKNQRFLKEKYIKRAAKARSEAYVKHLRERNLNRVGVPDYAINRYEDFLDYVKSVFKSLIPSRISIYTADSMDWPEICVKEADLKSSHLLAGMLPDCLKLSGFERLKQAFFPKLFMDNYAPENPCHNFNSEFLIRSCLWTSFLGGSLPAIGHANRDLEVYKKDASNIHESRPAVIRARQRIWIQSFAKYTLRWGWRVGFIFTAGVLISQSLTIYRLQDNLSHYIIGAAIPTSLYKWKLGLLGMCKTGLVGAIGLGIPIGFVVANLGYNPRVMHYLSYVEPLVLGPLSEYSMTHRQFLMSQDRLLLILKMLNSPHCDAINNDAFYREFTAMNE